MAQIASPGGLRPSAAVLTVADILSRNAPVPVRSQGDQSSTPLSVGSLLRREGRAPHAIDRPVRPRASRVDDDPNSADAATALVSRTGRTVKGGAIAAGTLLAAGSVFGATVLTDTSGVGDQDSATGPYAGQGILDGTAGPGNTPTVSISPAADTGGLDAGAAAPKSWVPVAFPSALAGTTGGAATPTATKAPAARTPAAPANSGGSGSSGGTTGSTPGTSNPGGTSGSGGGTSSNGAGGTVTAVTGAAGNAVDNVGSAVPDPVGGTVSGLGNTVSGTGKALGQTADTVTQPVTSTLQPVTRPVTSLVGGLVRGLLG